MTRVTLKEARERLSELLDELAAGGVVVVERDGEEIEIHSGRVGTQSGSSTPAFDAASESTSRIVPDGFDNPALDDIEHWGWEFTDAGTWFVDRKTGERVLLTSSGRS
jgi:hypothetical protein